MFNFGKKRPIPSMPDAETLKQACDIASGGAAAFIGGFDAAMKAKHDAMKARQAVQIARIRAALEQVMEEERPFVIEDGVPAENVIHAAMGCAMGAGSAAIGELFNTHKPDSDPMQMCATVQSMVNIFVDRQV